MKRLFIDTNVLLEEVLNRRYAQEAEALLDYIAAGKAEGYISVGAVYTLCYYVEKGLREFIFDKEERLAQTREVISQLLDMLIVVPQDKEDLRAGVNDASFNDLEDSCQLQAALAAGCDALVTINTKDFPAQTALPVVHLAEFEI